jgi:hypothetical protein
MGKTTKPIFELIQEASIPFDHHESDLYIPANEQTCVLLDNMVRKPFGITTFVSQIDGKLWYDIPFAYIPWMRDRL